MAKPWEMGLVAGGAGSAATSPSVQQGREQIAESVRKQKPVQEVGSSVMDKVFSRGTPSWMMSSPAEESSYVSDPSNPLAYLSEDQKTEQGRVGKAIGSGVKNTMRVGAGLAQGSVIDPLLAGLQLFGGTESAQQAMADYEKFRQGMGGEGFDLSRLVGNVVSPAAKGASVLATKGVQKLAPSMMSGNVGKVRHLANKAGVGVTQGVAGAMVNPVLQSEEDAQAGYGNFLGDKLAQLGTGAAFGGALGIPFGASRATLNRAAGQADDSFITKLAETKRGLELPNSPLKQSLDDYNKLRQMNPAYEATPFQALGLGSYEAKLMSDPVYGKWISRKVAEKQDTFSKGKMTQLSEKMGFKLDDETINNPHARMQDFYTKWGEKRDELIKNIQFIGKDKLEKSIFGSKMVSRNGIEDLGIFGKDFNKLSADNQQEMRNILDDAIFSKFRTNEAGHTSNRLSGEDFLEVEDGLRSAIKTLGQGSTQERRMGEMLKRVREHMRTKISGDPEAKEKLQNLNEGYSLYKKFEDATVKATAREGHFTPTNLMVAQRTGNTSNFARGKTFDQDETELAKRVMFTGYPDSGTAGRQSLLDSNWRDKLGSLATASVFKRIYDQGPEEFSRRVVGGLGSAAQKLRNVQESSIRQPLSRVVPRIATAPDEQEQRARGGLINFDDGGLAYRTRRNLRGMM